MGQPVQDRASGKILVADDEAAIRDVICRYLERLGYSCVTVPDGASALEQLRGSQFDLLISDINMPGNEDLAFIRQVPKVAEGLPIILLTGNPTVETAMQSVRLPVMAYLAKPVETAGLVPLVKEAVANARANRALSASRRRLADWAQDLEKIEEALRITPASKNPAPLNSYLGVTLHNLLLILQDWREVMEASPASKDGARQQPIVSALRETIEILEKTKQSFKSRELGDLRKKLELLLENSRQEK